LKFTPDTRLALAGISVLPFLRKRGDPLDELSAAQVEMLDAFAGLLPPAKYRCIHFPPVPGAARGIFFHSYTLCARSRVR
jgi:hypothetical protein